MEQIKNRIQEIRETLKNNAKLLSGKCDFESQTWIELENIELKKELKMLKKELKTFQPNQP